MLHLPWDHQRTMVFWSAMWAQVPPRMHQGVGSVFFIKDLSYVQRGDLKHSDVFWGSLLLNPVNQLPHPLPHHLRDVHAGRGVLGSIGDVDQNLGDEVHRAVALGGPPGVVHHLHGVLALLGECLVPTHALGGLGLRGASGCDGGRIHRECRFFHRRWRTEAREYEWDRGSGARIMRCRGISRGQ